MVATVVGQDGVTYLGAAGERSIGSDVEMSPETVGAIYSMTKAITAACAIWIGWA